MSIVERKQRVCASREVPPTLPGARRAVGAPKALGAWVLGRRAVELYAARAERRHNAGHPEHLRGSRNRVGQGKPLVTSPPPFGPNSRLNMSIALPPGAGHEVAQEITMSLVPKPHAIEESTAEQTAEQWVREGSAKLGLALERQLDRRLNRMIGRLRSGDGMLSVDLSDCVLLRDSGVEMLCEALLKCAHVQELRLQRTGCTHLGAGHVSALLVHHLRLRLAVLSHNEIGDLGAISLAPALRGSLALTSAHFSCCGIGDSGADALAAALAARCYSGLTELSLGFNDIGSAGVRALRDGVLHNRSLRTLNLCGLPAAPDELAAVQAALRPSAETRLDASSVQELVTRLAGPPRHAAVVRAAPELSERVGPDLGAQPDAPRDAISRAQRGQEREQDRGDDAVVEDAKRQRAATRIAATRKGKSARQLVATKQQDEAVRAHHAAVRAQNERVRARGMLDRRTVSAPIT